MRTSPISPEFHTANRQRFAVAMGEDAVAIIDTSDVLTRSGDFEYSFHPDPNFYYLTGIAEPESVLLLIPGHANAAAREMLFISGTSDFVGTWEGDRHTPEEATKLSGIHSVHPLEDLPFFLDRALAKHRVIYLNAEESLESHMTSPSLRRAKVLRDAMPTIELRSALPQLGVQRTIKDPAEVDMIRQAIEIAGAGILAVAAAIKPGMYEYALEAELVGEFTRRGSGHSFLPIIASGKNATVMHYMSNDAVIEDDSMVLMDVGAEVGWYAADIGRVLPSNGKFSSRQRAVYEAVLRVQQTAIVKHKPGTSILQIDEQMREDLIQELVALGVLSETQAKSKDSETHLRKHYAHISHHLGLDVHDTGDPRTVFKPGMVVSCEPGLYLKEEGIGVRIEDDILITETGYEVLSRAIPSDPDEIEALIWKGKS